MSVRVKAECLCVHLARENLCVVGLAVYVWELRFEVCGWTDDLERNG